jgi:hypothetical protein
MRCYKVIQMNHKIKIKNMGTRGDASVPDGNHSIRVNHELKCKLPKAMKRLLNFWI